ncbi:tripartite tricarboxylate transporter substrate binding protein [Stappia sp. ICDLI1TA098]|jgi:tripartite-type tricarboxylate transporter receptor subunit TctC
MITKFKRTATLAAAAALMLASGPAFADYPDRAVTIICPWSAGGGSDATARIVAKLLQDELGQPVNVVNRTGGGAVIGHTDMAEAKPDGYTLGNITTELSMFHWLGQSDLDYTSYTPIGLFNADYGAVFVATGSPYKTLQGLVDALKQDSAAVPAGGANIGGVNHLAWAQLVNEAGGGEAFWVPSEGAAPALQLLTSGVIQAAVVQFPEARALLDAGEIRPLATLGTERNVNYPDVPTVKEAANLDVAISGWRGLAAPKGTAPEIVATLGAALEKVTASDEFKAFMEARQFGPTYLPPEKFEQYLADRDAQFGNALKAAGLAK